MRSSHHRLRGLWTEKDPVQRVSCKNGGQQSHSSGILGQGREAVWWVRYGCHKHQADLRLKVDGEDAFLQLGELRPWQVPEAKLCDDEALWVEASEL